ncbi:MULTISPECIES: hypothetical protein [Pseudomonas]|jgi:Domain of unknown function (DUF5122) beta-propeller|uniref:hypothetical protein n=1 Tax=Pseudomonas TaxID=286 RepID=UPI0020C2231C|nr:hypothetical protein [Pseudomonas fluorescens]UTL93570.1 hypothetical protein NLL86_12820 [Pseudomonas fluorescens]
MLKKAGELDTGYGENGYAAFPGMPPDKNAYVIAVTQNTDGSLSVACSSQGEERGNYFSRLTPNGKWDDAMGFKPVIVATGQDASAGHFSMLTHSRGGNTYVAQAKTYFREADDDTETCAVGQYDLTFTALAGFGKLGITLHVPDNAPTEPNTKEPIKVLRSERVGGAIRSLYMAKRSTDSAPTAWLALLDPLSGMPLPGLGEDGSKTQLALPILDVEPGTPTYPLTITDSYFFDDGSLLLAGTTDWRQVIARFRPDGLLDTNFIIRQVAAFRKEVKVAVDLENQRIVTVAGTPRNFGEKSALIVRRYLLDGRIDTEFGNDGLTNVYFDNFEWNTVHGVGIDSEQRVMIGTNQRNGIDESNDATVTRLLANGDTDETFGSQGHFQDAKLQLENLLFNEGELKLLTRRGNDFLAIRLHL